MRQPRACDFICDKIEIYGGITEYWFKDKLKEEGFKYSKKKKEYYKYIKEIHTSFKIKLKRGFMYISFCPGKVLYGTNCYHLSFENVLQAVDIVKVHFNNFCFADHFESFDDFKVSRLDFALNLIFHQYLPEDKYYLLMELFKRISSPYMNQSLKYDTSISRFNKSYKDLSYTKKEEIAAHQNSHNISAERCPQYIRREAALFSRRLNKLFTKEQRKLKNINKLSEELIEEANRILNVVLFRPIPSKADVMKQIEKGWAHHAVIAARKKFAEMLNSPAIDSTFPNKAYEDAVNTGTKADYNRYLREFKSKGINPYWCDELAGYSLSTLKNSYNAYLKYQQPNTPCPPINIRAPYIIRVTKAIKKLIIQRKRKLSFRKMLGFT